MKKTSFLGVLFLFSILFFTRGVFAEAGKTERWVCLDAKRCATNPNLCSGSGYAGHRVLLSAVSDGPKPLPNQSPFIVECIQTTGGQICTTGRPDLDMVVYKNNDHLTTLKSKLQYAVQPGDKTPQPQDRPGFFLKDGVTLVYPQAQVDPSNTSAVNGLLSKVKADASGNIGPYEWESETYPVLGRKYLALNYFDATQLSTGAGGGQQEGTFDFLTVGKNCTTFNWDPYGRVFDSQTLDPIPGATVTLMKGDADPNNQFGSETKFSNYVAGAASSVTNPMATDETGQYSFVVENGNYKLDVAAANYTFPSNSLNSKYYLSYSDIYPSKTGTIIRQRTGIVHRDIPLDPKPGYVSNVPVKILGYDTQLIKIGIPSLAISGTVSHPGAKVTITTINDNTVLGTVNADNNGAFIINIALSKLKGNEENCCSINAEKVTNQSTQVQGKAQWFNSLITFIGALIQTTYAQESKASLTIEPILNYIQGYAYDTKGNPIPNAQVGVYLVMSDNPSYVTTADKNGFFRIGSENLPFMPYVLRYTMQNGQKVQTAPSTFVAQNRQYIETAKVDLTTYQRTSTGSATSAQAQHISPVPTRKDVPGSNAVPFVTNKVGSANTDIANASSKANANMLALVAVIVLLVGGAGGLLGFYLLKKKQQPPMY